MEGRWHPEVVRRAFDRNSRPLRLLAAPHLSAPGRLPPKPLVISLGQSLLDRPDGGVQREHVRAAARRIATLTPSNQLVISYGVGLAPSAGLNPCTDLPAALASESAQLQGLVGSWFAQELHNAGVTHPVAALITQTVVRFTDAAPGQPTQLIGPTYGCDEAQALADRFGWRIAETETGWRRVVPCLMPLRTAEVAAIRALLARGVVTVCGSGIAVTENENGKRLAVDAVVDPDAAAGQLAGDLGADLLMLSDRSTTMITRETKDRVAT